MRTLSSDCPKDSLLLRYVSGPALSRTAYIVSRVYEARFKSFILAFTLLMSLHLRSLRMPLATFLATTSRRPPPPRHWDQRASSRVKVKSFFSLLSHEFHSVSKSSLSSGGPPWKFIVLCRRHRRSRPSLEA